MTGRIVILGAGPAGIGAALELAERGFEVEVFERRGQVGGNAGSFTIAGLRADYGSHRLHPSTDPEIMDRLKGLLGDDLLLRPRHGRIHLSGRWIHFPLRPLDLALRLPPSFALGAASDALLKGFRPDPGGPESFATVLERGLGRTICRQFYFPYARKIWGLEPHELSPIQARRRVSAGSIGKLLRRLLPAVRRQDQPVSKRYFFYPRHGFGQISEILHEAAVAAGARVSLESAVGVVDRVAGGGFEVHVETAGGERTVRADHVWSTIPAPALVRLLRPGPPSEVLEAAAALELRAMVLVYLVIRPGRYSEYDAHYFPDPRIPFTRLSEPKNYAARDEPEDRTLLCAEIPCAISDPVWSMSDAELGSLVLEGLGVAGLPRPEAVVEVAARRLPHAYPIYRHGYEVHFDRLDDWLEGVPGLLAFGRQGLFAHDNTHHTLLMARSAVDCLDDRGEFDSERWQRYRVEFESHVVED